MYTPSHFAESRLSVLHEFIRNQPLAAIVTSTNHGLDADHIPLILDESRGNVGALQGHVARANPISKSVDDGADVLVLFHGAQHYISPNWYPSKQEHGRVVPTWNYMVVHAHGRIQWRRERSWLLELLQRTTNLHEEAQRTPWQVTDAPADFVDRMLEAIVGFEIVLSSLSGKWKLSQNKNC